MPPENQQLNNTGNQYQWCRYVCAHTSLIVLGGALLVTLGAIAGYLAALESHHHPLSAEVRLDNTEYTYINPLLDYQNESNPLLRGAINDLEETLKAYFDDMTAAKKVRSVSLYYRDLNNGPWFSVNSDIEFTPASLLKIPLLITYLKLSEVDPAIMEASIPYNEPLTDVPDHNLTDTPSSITVGKTYTVRQLLETMIIESDNTATILLQQHIDIDVAERVFTDFGVSLPEMQNPRASNIEPREYASFLRILYNSTYLSRDNSEYALSLMAQSNFVDGIKAGVPENVNVSNKFGVFLGTDGTKQLHDCGIVYDPLVNPYVLCIMTTGTDYSEMAQVIKGATKIIHDRLRDETW